MLVETLKAQSIKQVNVLLSSTSILPIWERYFKPGLKSTDASRRIEKREWIETISPDY